MTLNQAGGTDQRPSTPDSIWVTKALYTTAFLLAVGNFFERFATPYLFHLVESRGIGHWVHPIYFQEAAESILFILESILIVALFGLAKDTNYSITSCFRRVQARETLIAVLAAIATFLLGLPVVLKLDAHRGFISLLANQFYSGPSLCVLILIVILLPTATELVYRGIIFNGFSRAGTVAAAAVASSLLFARTWPIYNPIMGILLGITTALLFNRRKSIVPGLLANVLVTIFCLIALLLHALR